MQPIAPSPPPQVPAAVATSFRTAIQLGVVVRDLDQSMTALSSLFGIGPFRVVACPPPGREDSQRYHGRPARFRTRQAFADLGSIELELIQPVDGPSIWADFLAERGPGLHHVRFNVPDHEAVTAHLAAHGVHPTQEGAGIRDGTYWINYDTEKLVGFIVEIMQTAPGSNGRTPGVPASPPRPATPGNAI